MSPLHSLRFRVAFFYALLGATLSLLLSTSVYFAALKIADRLIDETLHAELEDSVVRHQRNPAFTPPDTLSIKGFVSDSPSDVKLVPAEISSLPVGTHDILLQQDSFRVLIEDRGQARYYLLFETESQHQLQEELLHFLIGFALTLTFASAGVGFWLALRIIAPVSRLAAQVSQAEPNDLNLSLSKLMRNDEVGELSRAFDRYLRRMREFIERESFFTADVSHELRTPLAVILGTVEVLEQDDTLSVKQRERVTRMRRAVLDMIELTHALLLMSRERSPQSVEPICQVGLVVQDCVHKHQALIENRNITMPVEINASVELYTERTLLEVIISNLIRNAVFNTESGTISIRLDSDRLVVRDTGKGMQPEELTRALERHYKGPASAGAGVGLSLVKRICDRYGWVISLESTAGVGTTAQIIFDSPQQ